MNQLQTRTTGTRSKTLKRLGISLAVLVVLTALFGLLGYYWLPGYAKSQLELRLSELLDRPVSVQAIEVKPYTLELSVIGFRIGEKNGSIDAAETFVSLDKLHIDISSESITRRAPVISTVTLDTLHVRLARESEHQFNISDLIEKFSRPSEDEDETAARFSVSNIMLRNGHLAWVDHYKQNHQEISEINFAIPFVANLDKVKANWIEPHFNAKVNGAPFSLEGKLRPFTDEREATLMLSFDDIDLTNIDEYVPFPPGISLMSGYISSNLSLAFTQFRDDVPAITLSGETELKRVAVRNESVQAPYRFDLGNLRLDLDQFDLTGQKRSHLVLGLNDITVLPLLSPADQQEAVVSLPKLAVDNLMIDLKGKQVVLKTVAIDGLNTIINREKDGNIDLTYFFTPADTIIPIAAKPDARAATIPRPGTKPSREDYEEWLQIAESLKKQPETTQIAASSIPVPNKKPSYEDWLTHAAQLEIKPEPEPEPEPSNGEAPSWVVQVKQFRLNDAAIRYADLALADVAPMIISPLDLTVENIDVSGVSPLDLKLSAQVNQRGILEVSGLLAWSPLVTDLNLNLKAIDLVSLQGWAGDAFNVLLTSGDISFQGTVKADGEPLKVAVNGEGQLGNFNILDQKRSRDLLRWKNLDINGLDFVNDPLNINIDTVKLGNLFARVVLLPNGELNLKQIVRQDEMVSVEEVEDAVDKKAESEPMPLIIGKIILQQGNVDFHDRFIKPNYHANLTDLAGQIGPIHSKRSGSIDIKGAIDRTAPLEIRGSIEPFGPDLLLDIVAKAREIDLPPFSPYSGKYVGYAIEKGKLSVDVHYHVEQGALTAENNVFLDQFTLGERVESEEAVSVPLELAIALLKNRKGEIDIHLPVKGSIDDPQFSLGSIILDAFINLITRAVTAPFALLGSMLGDGEELSEITFSPGSAVIEAEAESRLQSLSEVLKDRPALRLEIAGHVDRVEDHEGLKHVILNRQVKAQKLTADAKKGKTGGSLADVKLTPDEYSEYLETVYKAADFEKPTNFLGLTKSLPDAEMEQLLLAHIEVSDDDMQDLAEDRAVAAQNWLLEKGEISGDRLFVLGFQKIEQDDDREGQRVEFKLK
ncbi:MAG: DUF748 domain-containing protein [Burkholderiales bacterium]|nr:DUF748 domain-containing protein [Nitrosomonas sp.]MCP5276368.1 DUF748 domain-containing protein [Burkholderiales bacterium]